MTATSTTGRARRNCRIEEFGAIPAGWTERRAKFFLREVDERSSTGEEEKLSVSHTTGVTPRSQKNITMFMAESYEGHKLCRPGDVVINTMWAWMAALGVTQHGGIVSPSYGVYRPLDHERFDGIYLDRLLRTREYTGEYVRRSTGIRGSRLRLYPDRFLDIPLICPPLDEQKRIGEFLHALDRLVASAIANKRRVLGCLQEFEHAAIDRRVTSGIGAPQMGASVIDGVEQVPAHWGLSKVKHIARYINGYAFKPTEWSDEGRPIIRIQNLTGEDGAVNFYDGELDARYSVTKGDLLLSWSASLGVYVWNGDDAWLNQHIFKVIPDETKVDTGYYPWLARWFLDYMAREVHGSTMQHITKGKFGSLLVSLPPLSEQRAIAASLAGIGIAVAHLRDSVAREIDLVLEMRERLIADAVFGRIAVPVLDADVTEAPDLSVLLASAELASPEGDESDAE